MSSSRAVEATDDPTTLGDRDTDTSVSERRWLEREHFWVREQVRPVVQLRHRRPAEHVLDGSDGPDGCVTDYEGPRSTIGTPSAPISADLVKLPEERAT